MTRMKSLMNHAFSTIPDVKLERSKFNRSHGHKTTFDSGYLIPIYVDEALPGDTFNLKMTAFARMSTPLKPIMDNLHMDSFFFAVPIRLIWENWQRMNGEQDTPGASTDYYVPVITAPAGGGYAVGSIFDYMGIPVGVNSIQHSALWLRAYNLIYNTWFRDENLCNPAPISTTDASEPYTNYTLKRRGKRHDYFTSCLPWPQKATASITLPLGTEAPVITNAQAIQLAQTGSPSTDLSFWGYQDASAQNRLGLYQNPGAAAQGLVFGSVSGLKADLTNATAATINQLRQAFQVQRMLERDARGGSRYIEIIRSHFGVISPDARLQRPEYLGGGSSYVNISPIVQNSATGATGTPQGNLAAMGTVHCQHGFQKSFTEHCVLIGLVNVRADLTYQQGLDRMWSRRTRYDFYWPSLSHLGEQSVLNKEIFMQGSSVDNQVFGYQERYAEYRYKPSKITGKFRSGVSGTLDIWHLAQEFGSLPSLDSTFIEENPPMTRIMAVNTEPQFIFDSYFDLICVRPMPVYSVPGLIDHL